ncbi:MAG: Mur ligase family protein [Oscillospiraceae bacterium]
MPGRFSVYNTLGAMAACRLLGISAETCAQALRTFPGVKGRMEVVPTPGKPYTILIDYAHTPDALENVLQTARGFARGRVIAVFGCGGDREKEKRPRMGQAVARLADFAVVTSDNPRTEDPEAIIRDILPGMAGAAGRYAVEPDRRKAIALAMEQGRAGDVILLCGKGHETYQEIGNETLPMDEREIVRSLL